MNEEWIPLDNWWTLIKMSKKNKSFIKKFEKELNKKGFTIDNKKSKHSNQGRHLKLVIREEETGDEKKVTISPAEKGRVMKNAVAQVVGLFSGRKRRGQEEFKLGD